MILLNCLFITSLLIDSKLSTIDNDINASNKLYYFPENQTYSRPISNLIIWKTLLEYLKKEHFITIDDLVNEFTFLSREDIIKSCKTKITTDNNIYFYDFNKFMLSIVDKDYQKLLSLLKTDYLKTPSDWSTISSETSSITSLELNQDIIDLDKIESNKEIKVQFFNPKNINIEIKNTPKNIDKYPITINPLFHPIKLKIKEISEPPKQLALLEEISEQPKKLSPSEVSEQPKQLELSPSEVLEQPKKIAMSPKEIKIEPSNNINPNLKSRTRYTRQSKNYKKTNSENNKAYSWYLEYIMYCYKYIENCITNCTFYKKIDVPIWVKKYF